MELLRPQEVLLRLLDIETSVTLELLRPQKLMLRLLDICTSITLVIKRRVCGLWHHKS